MSRPRWTRKLAKSHPGKWKQEYGLGSLEIELAAGDMQAFQSSGHYVPFAIWARERRKEWDARASQVVARETTDLG